MIRPLDLAPRNVVHDRVAAGTDQPKQLVVPPGEHAAGHQPVQQFTLQGVILGSERVHPMAGRTALAILGDSRQSTIQHHFPQRRAVDQDQFVQIGVDTIAQGQVHQQGADDGVAQRMDRQAGGQLAGVVVQHQQ